MRSALRLFTDAFKAFLDDRATMYAAGLAYYTVFAIAPLLVFLVWLASIFIGRSAAVDQLTEQLHYLVGPEVAALLTDLARAANQRFFGAGGTILGIFGLIFGAVGIFNQLDGALNHIWGIRTVRPQNMAERMILVRRKTVPLLILFFAGLLFTSSVMVDTALGVVSRYLATLLPQAADLSFHINRLIVPFLAFATFAIIFKWLPDARARWRDVAVGALVTTALFSVGRLLLTVYLERSGTVPLFGAVGSIVILLIWVYYSAQILLYGAEFTKFYADRYGRPIMPRKLAAFHEVVQTHPDSDPV
jgi:membrane protein